MSPFPYFCWQYCHHIYHKGGLVVTQPLNSCEPKFLSSIAQVLCEHNKMAIYVNSLCASQVCVDTHNYLSA